MQLSKFLYSLGEVKGSPFTSHYNSPSSWRRNGTVAYSGSESGVIFIEQIISDREARGKKSQQASHASLGDVCICLQNFFPSLILAGSRIYFLQASKSFRKVIYFYVLEEFLFFFSSSSLVEERRKPVLGYFLLEYVSKINELGGVEFAFVSNRLLCSRLVACWVAHF